MKKQCLIRSLIGAPIGVMISIIITIIISLFTGKGKYYPVPIELINLCGNEIRAVIVQFICSILYGAVFGGASVIWDNEKWSLLKQTLIHFSVITMSSFPIAFFMYWIPHHVFGALGYIAIFFGIYLMIWLSIYINERMKIKKLNEQIVLEHNKPV